MSTSRTGGRNCFTSSTSPSGVSGSTAAAPLWCTTSQGPISGQSSTSTRNATPSNAVAKARGSGIAYPMTETARSARVRA